MQYLILIAVGVGLYFLSNWILERIEKTAGRTLDYRSLYFFGIFFMLLILAFYLIRRFF